VRILFDQGVPAPLRHSLVPHIVATAYEMGWSQLSNGDLLDSAETRFDAFLTTDQNLKYQQNLSTRRIAILVLPTTSWPIIKAHLPQVISTVNGLQPGDHIEIAFSSP
jgi:hypothetical protein